MAEMREISVQQAEEAANAWIAQGDRWHFHVLSPDCVFNDRPGRHAFVLENRTEDETYVVYSDRHFLELGRRLVKTLYGDEILTRSAESPPTTNETVRAILQHAQEMNARKIPWHYHMLLPDCKLNSHSGKWTIYFEDKENDRIVESVSEDEPVREFQELEILYYNQEE